MHCTLLTTSVARESALACICAACSSSQQILSKFMERAKKIREVRRCWCWTSYTFRRPIHNITRNSVLWVLQRVAGRHKNTWGQELETKMDNNTKTQWEMQEKAKDMKAWCELIKGQVFCWSWFEGVPFHSLSILPIHVDWLGVRYFVEVDLKVFCSIHFLYSQYMWVN